MHRLPRWPCRLAALGTLALAGVLLATSCQSKPPPEPASPAGDAPSETAPVPPEPAAFLETTLESIPDPVLRETAARASSATARVLQRVGSGPYSARHASAFYIGNDEWVTVGLNWRPDAQILLRREWSELDRRYEDDEVQIATLIGYDRPTGLALLRAPGAGVPSLRFADAAPPVGTELGLAGYWDLDSSYLRAPRKYVRANAPPLPPVPDYFTPGVTTVVLAQLVTEGGIAYLQHDAHKDEGWLSDGTYYHPWAGGPIFTTDGAVVGVAGPRLIGMGVGRSFDVAVPAIQAGLTRIRAGQGEPRLPPPSSVPVPEILAFCARYVSHAEWAAWHSAWVPGETFFYEEWQADNPATCRARAAAGLPLDPERDPDPPMSLVTGAAWALWTQVPLSFYRIHFRLDGGRALDGDEFDSALLELTPGVHTLAIREGGRWSAPYSFTVAPLQLQFPVGCDFDRAQAATLAARATAILTGLTNHRIFGGTLGLAFYVGVNEWVTAAANLVDGGNRLIIDRINLYLESEPRPVDPAYGVRRDPVRLIGIDAATGIALLSSGDMEGWKALRLAASAPLPEEPLLAVGYVGADSKPPRDSLPGPPSCRYPVVEATLVARGEEAPPPDWDELIVPSVEEAAVEAVLVIGGVPYLQHSPALEETFWTAVGGPIVNLHGDVVGILGAGPQSGVSVTAPAIQEALARIRAAAGDN